MLISYSNMKKIDSRIISFLRFPMIVGIVLIHSGLEIVGNSTCPIYTYLVTRGFIGTLTRVCVPLFFFISGYLFFVNLSFFGRKEYLGKLKKRVRSLLEPYLFYNALAICLFMIIGLIKPELQSGVVPRFSEWNIFMVARLFWDYGANLPIVPQFWFIRNLMVIVLLSPILFYLIKKSRGCIVILLAVLWGCNIWEFGVPGTMGLFFFSLGAFLSIHRLSPYSVSCKLSFIGYLYPLLAIIDIISKGEPYNIYLHNVAILSGIIFWIYLIGCFLTKHDKYVSNNFLLAATFFVYAMHSPYNGKIVKVMLHFLPSVSENPVVGDIQYVIYYFLTATLWILFLLSMFAIIRKVSPRFAVFLSGGR